MVASGLLEVADALRGTVVSSHAVKASVDGVIVEYRLVQRGADGYPDPWTEVRAELPAHYPLRMRIERGRVKPGELAIDLELGTPLFDEFFLVEAAPSDVVRHLVDEPARQFLLAQSGLLELRAFGRTIEFAKAEWVVDPAAAMKLATFTAALASRVREAYAAANVEPVVETGDPYRPQLTSGADPQVRREAELEQLQIVESMRSDRHARRGNLVMFVIVGGVLLAIALGVMLST